MQDTVTRSTTDDALDLLWGAKEIGKVIRRTTRQVNHMLSQGSLPAKKVAGRWCARRSDLLSFFGSVSSQQAA